MKVVKSSSLDAHDRKRFVELSPQTNADIERELEYVTALANLAFVRQSWREMHRKRENKKKK